MNKRNYVSLFIALLILLEVINPASAFAAWGQPDSQVSSTIQGITRGPDRFMAVGNSGLLIYSLDSSDGQFLGSIVTNTLDSLNDIIYAGGKYVIVGANGKILTFGPGNVLGTSTSNTPYSLGGIAYGGGKYVATGQFSTVVTSSDGVNWNSQTLPGTGGAYMYDVTYGDKFVAVGQYGEIWTSLDGVSWTERTSNTGNYLQGVTYANGQYVAVGTGGTIVTSPDGVTWTVQTSGASQGFSGITYGNGRFVAVGSGGVIASSANGVQWKLNASGVTDYITDIAYGNNTFVAVGNDLNLIFQNSAVTYDGNGYTGGTVPSDSSTYAIGASATVLSKGSMARTGYSFTGWNTAANGSGTSYGAGTTIAMDMDNVTLYAQWVANPTYTVTYNGNGSTGGAVPADSGTYETGASATVLGKGSLVKAGHTFAGWNTATNGSGTNYAAGAALTMGSANVTLFAKWTVNPTYTVTYNGNGSTGGAVPTDSGTYETGASATVLGKGSLVKAGHTFAGWNTAANGSGTNYAAGAALTMGSANVTLFAKWTVNPTYTVTYNGNGSTGGTVPADSGTYETGASATVLGKGSLVKAGHTFAGWNTAANGSGTNYAAGAALTMGSANVTLFAKWTVNPTYTVTYNGNGSTGGTVPADSGTYETGASATVLGKGSLVKAGYTFAGWNTAANGSGTSYAAGATLTMGSANVTLFAQWTTNPTYTVTYDGNGSTGGAAPLDNGTYETGASATVLGKGSLVKAGYTFAGWNTAVNGSGTNYAAGDTLIMGSTNVTLFAQWTTNATYAVTYDGNGSTGGTVPSDSGTYETGASATVLGKGSLVKAGYTFAGWNTVANGSGTNYASGATLTMGSANVTLFAKWTTNPTYTVTYNGNGSTGGTEPSDSGTYETGATATVLGNSGNLVRAGYTFAGWNTAANGSGTNYAAGDTLTMGSANVTLFAKWTTNPTYTVTYNGNGSTGGTAPSDSGTYETGATATVLGNSGNLVRAGYTFAGWNTVANGSGTSYAAGATLTIGSANVTLFAQWMTNPIYTVMYNGNGSTGGTVPTDSGTYETGASATVLGNTGNLVKAGYTFAGWNTAANGSGTSYAAGATLTMGSTNVTLFAKWTTNPTYTVTYDGNGSTGGAAPVDRGTYETGASATVLGKGSLVKAGYAFAGWNTAANGSGTSYAAGVTLTMGSANVTLFAQWTTNPTYMVTYDGNGSTGGTVPSDSGAYETGASATVLGKESLVKAGHTFAGWNTAANGSGTSYAAGATLTMGSANVTLFAQWMTNPTYTVTYDGNGSTGGAAPSDNGMYETGTTVTVLGNTGNLVKAGHVFAGWNTAANGSGTSYAAGATLTMGSANVTLFAQWTTNPTYTVTYDGNGSTGGAAPSDNGMYEIGASATVLGKGSLVKAGYTFTGWNTAANGSETSYAAGDTLTIGSANVTLFAQWTTNPTYTVTYDGNGSTGGAAPSDNGTYETGAPVTVLGNTGNLVKAGYTFAGWNTAANGSGTSYAAGTTLTMGSANVTLFAQWTTNPTYTVTYNGNGSTGGTVPSDSGTYETGASATVLGNTGSLVRAGYTFAGWNSAANGSGTSYAAGAALTMGSANVTLYAQWRASVSYGGPTYIKLVSTDGRLTLPAGAIGEVSFEDLVRIFIPSGAANKELTITIERELETENLLSKEKHPVSGVFEIMKNFSENFKKMVTISFAFEPSKLAEGQRPAVFYYDGLKKAWVEVAGGKVVGNWISVEVDYLATFTILCVENVNDQPVPCGPVDSDSEPEFSDISGHWAEDNIKQAVKNGIVSGYPDGTFKPNAAVTRAEFVVMLMNALKPQAEKAEIAFTDTAKIEAWAKKAVAQAMQAGIIRGFEDGSFRPDKVVTRSEMVVMIARALNLRVGSNATTDFGDDHHIPTWAKGAVVAMKKLGLIQGKSMNKFAPDDKTTRAEAATILLRIVEQKSK
ncbi:InlB B-repeat-containing protein [Paenibacillus mendelii]|uniref:InlB B-repeat-containing protein n=1 Tax=Paenibacillus mendelii TaxID=206163 RepID=A0ABV6JCJ4_9BACL